MPEGYLGVSAPINEAPPTEAEEEVGLVHCYCCCYDDSRITSVTFPPLV